MLKILIWPYHRHLLKPTSVVADELIQLASSTFLLPMWLISTFEKKTKKRSNTLSPGYFAALGNHLPPSTETLALANFNINTENLLQTMLHGVRATKQHIQL